MKRCVLLVALLVVAGASAQANSVGLSANQLWRLEHGEIVVLDVVPPGGGIWQQGQGGTAVTFVNAFPKTGWRGVAGCPPPPGRGPPPPARASPPAAPRPQPPRPRAGGGRPRRGCGKIHSASRRNRNSPVAQSVERLTVNQDVAGSSPARGANFFEHFHSLPPLASCASANHGATPFLTLGRGRPPRDVSRAARLPSAYDQVTSARSAASSPLTCDPSTP